MKRPVASDEQRVGASKAPNDGFAAKLPTLLSYLIDDKYDDGSARERSAVSLFISDGSWKAALNDKDLKRSLYVSADSLAAVLETLERQAAAPDADWRAWAGQRKKK